MCVGEDEQCDGTHHLRRAVLGWEVGKVGMRRPENTAGGIEVFAKLITHLSFFFKAYTWSPGLNRVEPRDNGNLHVFRQFTEGKVSVE